MSLLQNVGGVAHGKKRTGPQRDWLLWQLADSAFPTGGFPHSAGLEAAFQQGELRNQDELRAFIAASLCQLGHSGLPFMLAAFDDPAQWLELDCLCDSFTANHVTNRASRSQGQALLASVARIFPHVQLQLWSPGREPRSPGHLAPIFGILLRQLGLHKEDAARLFMFYHLRGLLSAAVRLGLIGPLQGQSMQHHLAAYAEEILARCKILSVHEIAQTAPLLDLWQANQDRLYSRLFQS